MRNEGRPLDRARDDAVRDNAGGCSRLERFTDVAHALGADDGGDARGVAIADFDRDGDLDLAINHNPGDNDRPERGDAVLLRNEIGARRSWLVVTLEGTESNRDAIGARVRLRAGELTPMRQVEAGSGYASQHGRDLSFGLGDAERVDLLEVRWPSGRRDRFEDLPVRTRLQITEGRPPEVMTTVHRGARK